MWRSIPETNQWRTEGFLTMKVDLSTYLWIYGIDEGKINFFCSPLQGEKGKQNETKISALPLAEEVLH